MTIDVILLTYGEPEKSAFREQWRYSNRILNKLTRLVAPIPKFVVPLLGAYRGYTRMRLWRERNYGSPLETITQRQTQGLREVLTENAYGQEWRLSVAFEFRDPSLEDILASLRTQNPEKIVLVPLYLPISDFTTGISRRDYHRFQEKHGRPLPEPGLVTFRACHRELAAVSADYLREQVARRGLSGAQKKETGLLLGCHGTVMIPPPGIQDAGYCDTKQMYDDLEELLAPEFQAVGIGWLNHRLGGEWTRPTLEESAKAMLELGVRQFVYYPFGFLADNAETQLEGRTVLNNLGMTEYHHIPCLNDDPIFLRFLARKIAEEADITASRTSLASSPTA
ncbi:MAG: ferrochelatase [bacterium]